MTTTAKWCRIAIAAESRTELGNLLSLSEPDYRLSDVVLGKSSETQLNSLVREKRMMTRIREHALLPRRNFCCSAHLDREKYVPIEFWQVKPIPLFQMRFVALITKFMGESATKLRRVFDAMVDIRGVFF